MTNITNGTSSVSRRWQMVLGLIPALFIGACAEETSVPPADEQVAVTARFIDNQTGAISEVTRMVDKSALEGAIDGATEAEKAGCVHIRFCNTTFVDSFGHTFPNSIVCDTNDQVCSSNSRFSECNGDANFVCGKARPMGFDPPIPCPISGICSSSGISLVWISTTSTHFHIP